MSLRDAIARTGAETIPLPSPAGIAPALRGKEGVPLMFEFADGRMPAAGNVFSTHDAVARSLGIPREALIPLLLTAFGTPREPTPEKKHPFTCELQGLDRLPVCRWYPTDTAPYINSGAVHVSFEGKANLSIHRLMVRGPRRGVIRLVERDLHAIHREALRSGEHLPVCVAVGCEAPVLLAASSTLPYGEDELRFANAISLEASGKGLKVYEVDGHTVPDAEVVILGYLDDEEDDEGPYVDVTGTVDAVRRQPVLHVERILAKEGALFHALLPGGAEHRLLMGMPKEPVIWRAVSEVVEVRGVRLTEGGCCWLHGVISIAKRREGDARAAMDAAFEAHPSMKRVIIVDEDIDIHDDRDIEWALATRFQASKDIVVIDGVRGSSLDPSAGTDSIGSKLGMDATMPLEGRERFGRQVQG